MAQREASACIRDNFDDPSSTAKNLRAPKSWITNVSGSGAGPWGILKRVVEEVTWHLCFEL
jgi:hypothetical protein